jgi:hypothetical protein
VISRRFSRWQQAAALAPALLLLVYLPAQVMLRCRIDGLLRSECCCPQPTEEKSSGPAFEAQDCCARDMVTDGQRPAADVARSATRIAPDVALAFFVAPPVSVPAPVTDRFDRAAQRYGPAREGPPLVLLKHAFLI